MRFQFYQPSKILQPYIQGYLEADIMNGHEGGQHTLFPNGFSGMFFNSGNLGKLILNEEFTICPISVYGQIDHPFTAIHHPGFYSLGILLKPTVLSKFLRTDMSEFTNNAHDGLLLRQDLKILYEKLQYATSISKKLELIEAYFITKLMDLPSRRTITDHAVHLIQGQGNISIENISKVLNISQRSLEINFKKSVGLSPKTYSLVMRFKRMEQQLKHISVASWDKMNFAFEYYDQNHFIKDFKRFTGHTPSAYLLQNLEMGRSYLANK
jgi:AraC-like DNA-binding protein